MKRKKIFHLNRKLKLRKRNQLKIKLCLMKNRMMDLHLKRKPLLNPKLKNLIFLKNKLLWNLKHKSHLWKNSRWWENLNKLPKSLSKKLQQRCLRERKKGYLMKMNNHQRCKRKSKLLKCQPFHPNKKHNLNLSQQLRIRDLCLKKKMNRWSKPKRFRSPKSQ